MEQLFWLIIILAEASIAFWSIRRRKNLSAGVLISIYIIALQGTYLTATTGALSSQFGELSQASYETILSKTLYVYLILFLITIAALHSCPIQNTEKTNKIREKIREAADKLGSWPAILIIQFIVIANMLAIDKGIMWENNTYLLMNSPAAYNIPPQTAMILRVLFGLSGIIGAFILPALFQQSNKSRLAILLPAWLLVFLFQLSAHSRTAAVYAFVLCITSYLISRKWTPAKTALASTFIVFSLAFALKGRALPLHGLGAIPDGIWHIFENINTDTFAFILVNLMQGIFATGDALLLNASHAPEYKILSISPLPSSIDGFDKLLNCCEIRVNAFVPMSAIAEAYHFGPEFYIPLMIFMYITIRSTEKFSLQNKTLYPILLNLFVFITFVSANAYQLRNTLRQFIAVVLIIQIYSMLKRLSQKRKTQP